MSYAAKAYAALAGLPYEDSHPRLTALSRDVYRALMRARGWSEVQPLAELHQVALFVRDEIEQADDAQIRLAYGVPA